MPQSSRPLLEFKFALQFAIATLCILGVFGCGASAVSAPPPVTRAEFAYTTNEKDGTLSGFSVNPATGELTPLSGFPLHSGVNPISAVHDPQNRFLIVADIAADMLHVYGIDPGTGMLAEIAPSPYAVGREPRSLAIDPTGKFIYLASQRSNASVAAFSLSASGALTPALGSPFNTPPGPGIGCCVVVDRSGKYVYVADSASVYSFSINATNGSLTLVSSLAAPSSCDALAVDPAGTFLYAVGAGANWVSAYALDSSTGSLTSAPSSPLQVQDGAYTISIIPSGKFAYTVEGGSSLVGYSLENGIFTSLGPGYPGALGSLQLTVDPSGTFIYAPQTGTDDNVSGFQINSSGALTALPGSPTPAGGWPYSLTITTP